MRIPTEDCTKEEAVEYLSKHIEVLQSRLEEANNRFEDAKEIAERKAWALDRAVRLFENKDASIDDILDIADKFFNHIAIQKPVEAE